MIETNRLRSLRKVRPARKSEMDSVLRERKLGTRRAFDILMEAQHHWDGMRRFREDRARSKRYLYGDQWKDMVTVDGHTMTEEDYIKEQGRVPLKNNLIRRLVKNVIGTYEKQNKEPTCTARTRDKQKLGEDMSVILQCNMQMNEMRGVLARSLEEFLMSGMVIHRIWYGWEDVGDGKMLDCWSDVVSPENFFVDCGMRDLRGWDVGFLGEIHDIDFGQLCKQFARNAGDYGKLRSIYEYSHDRNMLYTYVDSFGYSRDRSYDFLVPPDPGKCRVIEVWRKETKPRWRCHDYNSGEAFMVELEDYAALVEAVNAERIQRGVAQGMSEEDIPLIEAEWCIDEYWYYYCLSPFGDILDEGESPYEHKSHPYVFKAYPFIDGEIHSFVADTIDQQRLVNRLVMSYVWIMEASAKGLLVVPEESIGRMSLEEIADEWTRFNGVIAIKTKNGVPLPQQISSNSTNIGITELLNIQLKFFEDISGVNGALQGKPGYSGTSGALYAQQTENASTSLLDMLETYNDFIHSCAKKIVRVMTQYYEDGRVFTITGHRDTVIYYRDKHGAIGYDISISDSTNTPAYRQLADENLMRFWERGQLPLNILLEFISLPYADALLQRLNSEQEQAQAQAQAQGMLPAGQEEQGQMMMAGT